MKKSFAKRLSPQPYCSKNKRQSHKENTTMMVLPMNCLDSSKILTQNNECELTDKQLEGKVRCRIGECRKGMSGRVLGRSGQSVACIRESIRDILGESAKVNDEIKKIRERIEAKCSLREHSSCKFEQPDFDESSIQASSIKDQSFSMQIDDLKTQITVLKSRLNKGEAKIRQKNLENFSLQFTICDLNRKLNKLKQKKTAKEKNNLCQIF